MKYSQKFYLIYFSKLETKRKKKKKKNKALDLT